MTAKRSLSGRTLSARARGRLLQRLRRAEKQKGSPLTKQEHARVLAGRSWPAKKPTLPRPDTMNKTGGLFQNRLPNKITRAWLLKHNACTEQVQLFTKTFRGGIPVTAPNLRKAVDAGLDLQWLDSFIRPSPEESGWQLRQAINARYFNLKNPDNSEDETTVLENNRIRPGLIDRNRIFTEILIMVLGLGRSPA